MKNKVWLPTSINWSRWAAYPQILLVNQPELGISIAAQACDARTTNLVPIFVWLSSKTNPCKYVINSKGTGKFHSKA